MMAVEERVLTHGLAQGADGKIIFHIHQPGGTLSEIDGQQDDGACAWCERGVPLYASVRRVVDGGHVQVFHDADVILEYDL